LRSLTSIPEGFNPTVGGSLYLSSLTSIPEGFNPTVGGNLYLRSLTSIPEGFNPTVGGSLDLSSESKYIGSQVSTFLSWQNGKYISVDGIFCETISKKGNVWKVKKYATEKTFYIVSDGNGIYSHGNSVKEAKEDLIFKTDARSKDDYKDLTLKSTLKFDEAVKCYRVITGACQFGVKEFLSRKNIERKKMSIAKIIELTNGEYGSQSFSNFFNNK